MGRFSPLAGAIALAFVALACAAVAMHSAHRQTELLAAMPPYMSSLEQKAPSQSALLRQQQLMDGLVVDPNSENPSADFYADNDDGAYDNEDDVEVTPSRLLACWLSWSLQTGIPGRGERSKRRWPALKPTAARQLTGQLGSCSPACEL